MCGFWRVSALRREPELGADARHGAAMALQHGPKAPKSRQTFLRTDLIHGKAIDLLRDPPADRDMSAQRHQKRLAIAVEPLWRLGRHDGAPFHSLLLSQFRRRCRPLAWNVGHSAERAGRFTSILSHSSLSQIATA